MSDETATHAKNLDLPHYNLKRSSRAKYPRLQINRLHGLQITVPDKFDLTKIPELIHKHHRWIQKHLKNYPALSAIDPKSIPLPDALNLFAVGETWKINYVPLAKIKTVAAAALSHDKLVVTGNIKNRKAVKNALIKWLCERAQETLLPQLQNISEKTGIRYHHAIIRSMKTRWGSCTANKKISLSPSLLFLTSDLAKHIMLHELCHTVHLDHSKRFWRYFEKHCAQSNTLRKEVSKAHRFLPLWLEMD